MKKFRSATSGPGALGMASRVRCGSPRHAPTTKAPPRHGASLITGTVCFFIGAEGGGGWGQ